MKKFVGILSLASILVVATACDTVPTNNDSNSSTNAGSNASVVISDSASGTPTPEGKFFALLAQGKKKIEDTITAEEVYNIALNSKGEEKYTRYYEDDPTIIDYTSQSKFDFALSVNVDNITADTVAKYTAALPVLYGDRTELRYDYSSESSYEYNKENSNKGSYTSNAQAYYGNKVFTSIGGSEASEIISYDVTDGDLVNIYSYYNMIYGGVMSVLSIKDMAELQTMLMMSIDSVIDVLGLTDDAAALIKSIVDVVLAGDYSNEVIVPAIITLIAAMTGNTEEQITTLFGDIITNLLNGVKAIDFASLIAITMKSSGIVFTIDFEAIGTEIQKFFTTCGQSIAILMHISEGGDPSTLDEIAISKYLGFLGEYVDYICDQISEWNIAFGLKLTGNFPSGITFDMKTVLRRSVSITTNPEDPSGTIIQEVEVEVQEVGLDVDFAITSGAAEIDSTINFNPSTQL